MKRFLLLTILLGAVALLGTCKVHAQSPPAAVYGGALFENHGNTDFALFVTGQVNIMTKKSKGAVVSQIYTKLGGFLADWDHTGGKQDLEAITGFIVGERTIGDFSLALGTGILVQSQPGENAYHPPVLAEFAYKPFNFAKITVGSMYIPITGKSDKVFVYGGIGLYVSDII